ncbi:hypothetical protein FKM82_021628 [Ascaphus truei]
MPQAPQLLSVLHRHFPCAYSRAPVATDSAGYSCGELQGAALQSECDDVTTSRLNAFRHSTCIHIYISEINLVRFHKPTSRSLCEH